MPYPNLLHPVDVIFKLRRSDQTLMNTFQEPVGKVTRDEEQTIKGQVYWQDQVYEAANVGISERTIGYILLRTKDVQATFGTITLKVGDQIVKIGNLDVNYYIYRFEYRGHYPKYGATLIKAWFGSKTPVKHR